MISSTLGAPSGGMILGGHQGLESAAVCLISPPNCGIGGGRAFDFTGSPYAGEPGFAGPPDWPTVIGTKHPSKHSRDEENQDLGEE